jgi:glycosyltransferase involved in cell wall biosynthesis
MGRGAIALFLPNLGGGGAERVMAHLARSFAERGLTVDMVLADADGPMLAGIPKNVRIVDLEARRMRFVVPALVRYLSRDEPSVVLSALNSANIMLLVARRISRSNARVVVSIHHTLSRFVESSSAMGVRLAPLLNRLLLPWADGIVAVSAGAADDFARVTGIPRDRIRVIYNPVVTPELFEQARDDPQHPWLSGGGPPVVIGVGRLDPAKDFGTLIRAFRMVEKKKQARLMILGEGEERPHLEALVRELDLEEAVSLPGFISNPYAYMARASVFVLSSAREALPTALIEAMALGLPVVATDCESGPDEVLEGGRLGQLVRVGDSEGLAEAILSALEEETDRDLLRERAKDFSIESIPDQYLQIMLPDGPGNDHGEPAASED